MRASTQKNLHGFSRYRFFAIEWRHCEISTALLLIYFFKVNISNVNISDTVRASSKNTTFIDFDICHRMTQLRQLYSVTWTYIFKGNIANSHQAVSADFNSLVRHPPSSCSYNHKSKIWNCNIYKRIRINVQRYNWA